uniref:Olfactory receptor 39 n=1 Tax=Meteorus pulchricornis TaxID=51522 RepID=A0A1S5VFM7_9HYME|nr:olfactory receptor 39 [Meteorus pulchricornis]
MSSLSYNIFVLRCLGLWYSDDWITGWKAKIYIGYTALIVLILYSFTLSHFIMLYECIDDANEFANTLFMLLTLIAICGKMFNIVSKRQAIEKIMTALQTDPFTPEDPTELSINSECIRKINFCRLYTILYGILTESTCTMLTLASLNRDVPRGDLPYKAWLPYTISSPNAYWFAYSHQTFGLYIAATTDVAFDTFVPGLMMMTCGQIQIFNHRFEKIFETLKSTTDPNGDALHLEDQAIAEKKLVADCIEHHTAIFESSILFF